MRTLLTVAAIGLPLLAALCAGPYESPQAQTQALGMAIFATAVLLWISELIALPATALLIPTLIVLYGVQAVSDAFLPFSSSIIFLFLGAFLLAQAMQKHRLDQRIACWVQERT